MLDHSLSGCGCSCACGSGCCWCYWCRRCRCSYSCPCWSLVSAVACGAAVVLSLLAAVAAALVMAVVVAAGAAVGVSVAAAKDPRGQVKAPHKHTIWAGPRATKLWAQGAMLFATWRQPRGLHLMRRLCKALHGVFSGTKTIRQTQTPANGGAFGRSPRMRELQVGLTLRSRKHHGLSCAATFADQVAQSGCTATCADQAAQSHLCRPTCAEPLVRRVRCAEPFTQSEVAHSYLHLRREPSVRSYFSKAACKSAWRQVAWDNRVWEKSLGVQGRALGLGSARAAIKVKVCLLCHRKDCGPLRGSVWSMSKEMWTFYDSSAGVALVESSSPRKLCCARLLLPSRGQGLVSRSLHRKIATFKRSSGWKITAFTYKSSTCSMLPPNIATCKKPVEHSAKTLAQVTCAEQQSARNFTAQRTLHTCAEKLAKTTCAEQLLRGTCAEHLRRATCQKNLARRILQGHL